MTDLGRGAIGIPCREQGRWSTFWECVAQLDRPPGTELIIRYNNSVAQARNQIARQALDHELDWVFWLDDDLLFRRDVLTRMLRRPEQIVIGLTLMRCTRDGSFRPIWSDRPVRSSAHGMIWEVIREIRPGPNGLMRLSSGTGGGVLTRRAVFDTVPAPWWQMGQHDPEMFWEDIFFYERASAAGFDIWGDPSIRFGHYTPTVLWPHERADGTWSTVFGHGFEGFLEQPWPQSVEIGE